MVENTYSGQRRVINVNFIYAIADELYLDICNLFPPCRVHADYINL